jgi:hypothetical protein
MKRVFAALISITLVLSLLNTGQAVPVAGVRLARRQRSTSAIRFAPRQIQEANRRLRYTIKARYPQAAGAIRDPRLAKMNLALKNLAASEVAEFRKYFKEPTERLGPTGSYYDSNYFVSLATNDLVSIIFGVSTYGEGAAHPNHNTHVFNYDLRSGKILKLADLFKPNSNYLGVISNYAMQALKEKLGDETDADWIESGAGAKLENYQSWTMTRTGLEITFDPYQIASYAAGTHEVVIPYTVLKDVIEPTGPLGRIQN